MDAITTKVIIQINLKQMTRKDLFQRFIFKKIVFAIKNCYMKRVNPFFRHYNHLIQMMPPWCFQQG
jgi:hypothetical protein